MNHKQVSQSRRFNRPVIQANEDFHWIPGDEDPAEMLIIARDSAWALLHRVRKQADSALLQRVLSLAEDGGIGDIAELWSNSHAQSLPGVLWRIYLLREVIRTNPQLVEQIYRVGLQEINTIDEIIAGAEEPVTPDSLKSLSDTILRGLFVGDFGAALDRAASACIIFAAGAAALANVRESDSSEDGTRFTRQALRFDQFGRGLKLAAKNWRAGLFE